MPPPCIGLFLMPHEAPDGVRPQPPPWSSPGVRLSEGEDARDGDFLRARFDVPAHLPGGGSTKPDGAATTKRQPPRSGDIGGRLEYCRAERDLWAASHSGREPLGGNRRGPATRTLFHTGGDLKTGLVRYC